MALVAVASSWRWERQTYFPPLTADICKAARRRGEEEMQIYVLLPDGRTIITVVQPSYTVDTVKGKINSTLG